MQKYIEVARAQFPGLPLIIWEYDDGVHHLSCGDRALDIESADTARRRFEQWVDEHTAITFEGA